MKIYDDKIHYIAVQLILTFNFNNCFMNYFFETIFTYLGNKEIIIIVSRNLNNLNVSFSF